MGSSEGLAVLVDLAKEETSLFRHAVSVRVQLDDDEGWVECADSSSGA